MADKSTQIAAIETAVVTMRRTQKRRALARLARRRGTEAALPDAVYELLDALADESATVSEVAAILDVDQPRASRLAGLAIDAGLVERTADQRDGRRSLLLLTATGEQTLAHIRDFRRQVIAEAISEWSDADRAALARLLPRFVHSFGVLTRR